jgi:plasmid maintenance system killer protein
VALFSGHSLRAGYATSAAARDMPGYRIQLHTRHKSAQVVAVAIRANQRLVFEWEGNDAVRVNEEDYHGK